MKVHGKDQVQILSQITVCAKNKKTTTQKWKAAVKQNTPKPLCASSTATGAVLVQTKMLSASLPLDHGDV